MSETPPDLLLLEWLCDSLDVSKYKGENGCQVLLLLISWEMQFSTTGSGMCVDILNNLINSASENLRACQYS